MDPELRALYQEIILEHNKDPAHFGKLEPCTCHAHGKNTNCGDEYTVYVRLNGDLIESIQFNGEGCAISKASGSMMTQALTGVSKEEAAKKLEWIQSILTDRDVAMSLKVEEDGDIAALSGVGEYPQRVYCAQMTWELALEAIRSYSQD